MAAGMDWDDLRLFLAVARAGSLTGAGRALGVRHSTVLRRMAGFETKLGLRLFDRGPGGYALTAAGRELLEEAAEVETRLVALERRLSGRDRRLTGTVRIATLGALAPWLAEALAAFRALHPGIRTEIAISHETVSLARHEADIAIRVSRNPPDSLIGRRIATLVHGVYGAREHPPLPPGAALAEAPWVTYAQGRADLPQARWVAANIPDSRIVLRTDHTGMMIQAVRAGIGLGLFACYLCDADPALVRLRTLSGLGLDLWILTHPDLRDTPRVRVLMDHLAAALAARRPALMGRMPSGDAAQPETGEGGRPAG